MGSNCVWAIFVEGVDPSTTSSSSAARLKRFCDQKNINSAAIFCGAVLGHDVAAGGGLLRRPRLLQYREILPYLVGYKQLLYTLSKLNLVHFTLSQEFFVCKYICMYALFLLLIQCICTILLSQGNYRRIFLIPSDISLRRFDAVAFLMYSRCPFPPHGSPMLAQPLFDDHSFIGEQRISMAFVCVLYVCMYVSPFCRALPLRVATGILLSQRLGNQ